MNSIVIGDINKNYYITREIDEYNLLIWKVDGKIIGMQDKNNYCYSREQYFNILKASYGKDDIDIFEIALRS